MIIPPAAALVRFASCVALLQIGCADGPDKPRARLTLGATSTVEDTGLLQALADSFRVAHPEFQLVPLSGGTGEVLEMGRRGDVDVMLTHDAAAESAFVAVGDGVDRWEVMFSDFVIAGPAADPARVRGMLQASRALERIAAARARFVSRGDDSGTHRRERQLWRGAGLTPDARGDAGWYIEAGVGMADALRLAAERDAYILTDRGTWLVLRAVAPLEVLVQGDSALVNRYAVVRATRAANPAAASAFADWIISERAQSLIDRFGRAQYGEPLFNSVAGARRSGRPVSRR